MVVAMVPANSDDAACVFTSSARPRLPMRYCFAEVYLYGVSEAREARRAVIRRDLGDIYRRC